MVALSNVGGSRAADDLESEAVYTVNNGNEMTAMALKHDGTAQGTTSFTYDDWGRMVTKSLGGNSAAYAYRYGGMLYNVDTDIHAEADVTNQYRGDKKRHSRVSGGATTVYNWGAGWVNVSEENGAGTLQRTFVPVSPAAQVSGTLGQIEGSSPSTGAAHYFMQDHLGSTRSAYDASKARTASFDYSPYGAAVNQGGPDTLTHRYTGHRWDRASDLYYAPYRHYAPDTARWTTRDPLGMVDGPNVYRYASNSPTRYMDELGLAPGDCLKPTVAACQSCCRNAAKMCIAQGRGTLNCKAVENCCTTKCTAAGTTGQDAWADCSNQRPPRCGS